MAGWEADAPGGGVHMLSTRRFLAAATDRAERFRPILDEFATLPATAVAAELNARNVRSPRGGRWYAAQVIRMRNRLANGPPRPKGRLGRKCPTGAIGSAAL
jgi:hypothetical protein